MSKYLLDDSNAAKDMMDKVKKKLKLHLRPGSHASPRSTWPKDQPDPPIVMQRLVKLMHWHKRVLDENFRKLSRRAVERVQTRWCCAENPLLFRERWEKLFSEFREADKVDPSKISELYDTMKYDALHNRQFLETMFDPETGERNVCFGDSLNGFNGDVNGGERRLPELRELYHLAKILFEYPTFDRWC